MNHNQIYSIQGTDYTNMTKELLNTCDLSSLIGEKSRHIGIKPNLVSPSEASWGATTHPEVVAGIIEYLRDHGFYHLTILEGSWVGDRTEDAYDICGYRQLCETYQVPFVDMQKEAGVPFLYEGEIFEVGRVMQEISFLINVPVLKGHCQTKVTCALKNLKGLIPNREKRRYHSLGLHRPIAVLNKLIHQDFVVVDNICGDLDFEDGGHPVVMNRILAGRDPVLIDAYAADMLHYRPEDVPYILEAQNLGIGSDDLSTAEFIPLRDEKEIRVSSDRKIVEIRDLVEEVESCSACYGALIPALDRLKEEGVHLDSLPRICIGQGFQGRTGELGIGRCTRDFVHTLKGCPPEEEDIYTFLKSFEIQTEQSHVCINDNID